MPEPIQIERVPGLYTPKILTANPNAVFALNLLLSNLQDQVRSFRAALNLFDHPTGQIPDDILRAWKLLACRDAVMSVYHFGCALRNIREGLGACPGINAMVDSAKLRLIQKKFTSRFPEWEQIRHAIAHASELSKNEFAIERNAMKGPFEGNGISIGSNARFVISSHLHNRTFLTGIDGGMVKLDMTEDTLRGLATIMNEIYLEFRPAESTLLEMLKSERKK